jgi:hypothetical protein
MEDVQGGTEEVVANIFLLVVFGTLAITLVRAYRWQKITSVMPLTDNEKQIPLVNDRPDKDGSVSEDKASF